MTKALNRRYIQLTNEFTTFVVNHPGPLKELSGGVRVVFTSDEDPELSEVTMAAAKEERNIPHVEARKTSRGWRLKTLA